MTAGPALLPPMTGKSDAARRIAIAVIGVSLLSGLSCATPAASQETGTGKLAGTYHAKYPALIGDKGEIWQIEKFLTIRPTEEPNLFHYEQCWRRVDGRDWNTERGGLVVTSAPNAALEFAISEAHVAGPKQGEARPGVMTGRMTGSDGVEIIYTGLENGVVFRGDAKRTSQAVDKASCPVD